MLLNCRRVFICPINESFGLFQSSVLFLEFKVGINVCFLPFKLTFEQNDFQVPKNAKLQLKYQSLL